MPFPGWSPALLTDDVARGRYEAGERVAVIAGDPSDPAAGLVLDRGNARLALRFADPALQLVYTGADLTVAEALWVDPEGRQCWARRLSPVQLRVARRPAGAAVWVEELLAYAPADSGEGLDWPDFGEWSLLTSPASPPWAGALNLVDADTWILDALDAAGVLGEWRALGRKHDAPRAFGVPPEVQVTLAEPLGWTPAGRRWRKQEKIRAAQAGSAAVDVVTDATFAAGAGASGEIVTKVTCGDVEVVVDLPSATVRVEARGGKVPGAYPRPSTGAQIAVTAILETGGAAHEAIVEAIKAGGIPDQWSNLSG